MTDPVPPADPEDGASAPDADADGVDNAVAAGGGEKDASGTVPPREEEAADEPTAAEEPTVQEPAEDDPYHREGFGWYVLKVTSNREATAKKALTTLIRREAMEEDFGEIVVPEQRVLDPRTGKARKDKLFPGYMMVQMRMNNDSWSLVRETSHIGGFTGGHERKRTAGGGGGGLAGLSEDVDFPPAMSREEVDRMLGLDKPVGETGEAEEAPKVQIDLPIGETVKIKEGPFETFEGTVEAIDELHGKITVLIEIFGSPRPTEFEYWQVEKI